MIDHGVSLFLSRWVMLFKCSQTLCSLVSWNARRSPILLGTKFVRGMSLILTPGIHTLLFVKSLPFFSWNMYQSKVMLHWVCMRGPHQEMISKEEFSAFLVHLPCAVWNLFRSWEIHWPRIGIWCVSFALLFVVLSLQRFVSILCSLMVWMSLDRHHVAYVANLTKPLKKVLY